MLSHFRKQFVIASLLLLILSGAAQTVYACSCGRNPTVLDAYDHADVVVIVTVVSVEKVGPELTAPEGQMSDGRNYVDGVKSTTMRVEQVFKGALKIGEEMIFAQGGGADCIWTFNEKDIGKKYLFYLGDSRGVIALTSAGSTKVDPADLKVWIAITCGRSSNVDYAGDDLLYLKNRDKLRGRTRISGTLSFDYDGGESVAGRNIRIAGGGKTYNVKTDENGVYEIYDVPAGKYLVEPEIPQGWKVGRFWLGYSPSFAGTEETERPKQISIVLEAKKHAGLDIRFDLDNAVRGHIFDPSGQPMKGVCLDLIPADGTKGVYLADCTEEDGAFEIDEIPPGAYVLVINNDGEVTSSEPFGTFYYPSAKKREDATVLHIGIGDFVKNLEIHPTVTAETIRVDGLFLYSDGKPVVSEWVEFKAARLPKRAMTNAGNKEDTEDDDKDDPADARAETDENGRFSIKILKGASGSLWGEMYTFEGEFENCPKLDNLIKKSGTDHPIVKTNVIQLVADSNLYKLELTFPFPRCEKAKE